MIQTTYDPEADVLNVKFGPPGAQSVPRALRGEARIQEGDDGPPQTVRGECPLDLPGSLAAEFQFEVVDYALHTGNSFGNAPCGA